MARISFIVLAVGLTNCLNWSVEEPSDGDADADGDSDNGADADGNLDGDIDEHSEADGDMDTYADGDLDTAVDVDADVETEADADGDPCGSGGSWFDPASGLCWQDTSTWDHRDWTAAADYCDSLDLNGHGPGSWHLPSISELRSIVRGCPETETGGACGVSDSCLDDTCRDTSCSGCAGDGPDTGGAYWPVELSGPVGWHWSSSSHSDDSSYAWFVHFRFGLVDYEPSWRPAFARCVRAGL